MLKFCIDGNKSCGMICMLECSKSQCLGKIPSKRKTKGSVHSNVCGGGRHILEHFRGLQV